MRRYIVNLIEVVRDQERIYIVQECLGASRRELCEGGPRGPWSKFSSPAALSKGELALQTAQNGQIRELALLPLPKFSSWLRKKGRFISKNRLGATSSARARASEQSSEIARSALQASSPCVRVARST